LRVGSEGEIPYYPEDDETVHDDDDNDMGGETEEMDMEMESEDNPMTGQTGWSGGGADDEAEAEGAGMMSEVRASME
jgi:hypothetical protein